MRLSLYKRFASAASESEVEAIAEEMEGRFGPAPDAARTFVRAMALKPELRRLRALGCEASRARVVLHLADDSPIDLGKLVALVTKERARASSSRRTASSAPASEEADEGDAIDRIQRFLDELSPLAP